LDRMLSKIVGQKSNPLLRKLVPSLRFLGDLGLVALLVSCLIAVRATGQLLVHEIPVHKAPVSRDVVRP
jgi:hypothetical protein